MSRIARFPASTPLIEVQALLPEGRPAGPVSEA